MHIYRLLIMFAYSMGWAMVWAMCGPSPCPRPLVLTIVGFDFVKSFGMV